jgi:enediyne biosynthesis protein E4
MQFNRKIYFIVLVLIAFGILIYYVALPFISQPDERKEEVSSEAMIKPPGDANILPTFREIPFNFDHQYNSSKYAFAGSSLIDVNGDGIEEVFIGGGEGQRDGLFFFENEEFVDRAVEAGLGKVTGATGGALSVDADNDGDVDLYVSRFDGVYLYTNTRGVFSEQMLNITFESDAVPLSISGTDLNRDGLVDLYISTFKDPKKLKIATFNDTSNKTNNLMLINKGGNVFEDVTESSGLVYSQNTFQAMFVDLNNDTFQDLVIAPNTDKVVIYENNRNGTFDKKSPLTDYGFWMGLTAGDIDNDGDIDLFVSNAGNTIPLANIRGDLLANQILNPEWTLLRNTGSFAFTDVTESYQLTGYEFAWGAKFEDLNLNGTQDLIVTENYVKWPAHRLNKVDGRVLLQDNDKTFKPITEASGAKNPHYGTSPLISDFNRDGYPDIVYVNFNGQSKAYISEGGSNNYVVLTMPDEAKSLGARAVMEKTDGTRISQQFTMGEGLMTDASKHLLFGLGNDAEVKSLKVYWPDGRVQNISPVKINSFIDIVNQ